MVELNSKKLNESYLNFIAIRNAIFYVQEATNRRVDDSFLRTIGFPFLGEKTKDKKNFVLTKMDAIGQSVEELMIIGIVSDFEKIIFDYVSNACGEISKVVNQNYYNGPFRKFSSDFIKTTKDIDKLTVIKGMISPKLPNELSKKFAEVIDFRNRLAHGKRFGAQSLMTFDETAQTLDDVLDCILD